MFKLNFWRTEKKQKPKLKSSLFSGNNFRPQKLRNGSSAASFSPVKLSAYPKRTKKEMKLIDKKPFGDKDKDRVPNYFDCKPLNKKKQGSLPKSSIKKALYGEGIKFTKQNKTAALTMPIILSNVKQEAIKEGEREHMEIKKIKEPESELLKHRKMPVSEAKLKFNEWIRKNDLARLKGVEEIPNPKGGIMKEIEKQDKQLKKIAGGKEIIKYDKIEDDIIIDDNNYDNTTPHLLQLKELKETPKSDGGIMNQIEDSESQAQEPIDDAEEE